MVDEVWICQQCDEIGVCEICESCERHCVAKKPNDLAEHRKFDTLIASVTEETDSN